MPKETFSPPPKTCVATKKLPIACFNENGMLQPGHRKMLLTWRAQGQEIGSIAVESVIGPAADGYLVLAYTIGEGRAHEYTVELVRVASNLPGSTASRFYLLCPVSGRRASILFLHHGTELFAHGQAYPLSFSFRFSDGKGQSSTRSPQPSIGSARVECPPAPL